MKLDAEAQKQVASRLAASEPERAQTWQYLLEGEIWKADAPERIEKRKARLLTDQSLIPILGATIHGELAGSALPAAPADAQRAFERQIGGKDTQPCWFLSRGAEIRRTIGRIHIRSAVRRIGWGSGFLVAPNLLLTNQHVLSAAETARLSRVEFDYEELFSGERLPSATFDLRPELLFITSPARDGLDYALVAVAERARDDGERPGAALGEFGYNVLIREEGKLVKGELIHSIHHPEGQPRQVSLRENRLTAVPGDWLHYETDTEPGSSGAPLYNSQWEVVGVHHSAVERRNAEGKILAIGGALWTPDMGERQKWWAANEGLRISRFIADVERRAAERGAGALPAGERIVTAAGQALLAVMLNPDPSPAGPELRPLTPPPARAPAQPARRRFRPE
jgi:endonuclease G